LYFLFAAPPRYGRLLQTMFGRSVAVYRRGERIRNVVVPVIPATELSGRIYDLSGHPISGCEVSAVTPLNIVPAKTANLDDTGSHALFYNLPESEDPRHFLDVGSALTGPDGSFTLIRLGADRYFLPASCPNPIGSAGWQPAVYPSANSVKGGQENVLHPGDHRSRFDFHLLRARTYTLEGKILFIDGANPQTIHSQSMQVIREDSALTLTWRGREMCSIDASAGQLIALALGTLR